MVFIDVRAVENLLRARRRKKPFMKIGRFFQKRFAFYTAQI